MMTAREFAHSPVHLADRRGISRLSGAAITGLLFVSVGLYPFPTARLSVGTVEVPYASAVLAALGLCLLVRTLVDSHRMEVSRRVVAATWCLLGSVALSTLGAYLVRRTVDASSLSEIGILATVPLLLAAVLHRHADINLSFGAFVASLLFLVGFGLYRFVTEQHAWVEFHYEEATRNGDAFYLAAGFCASLALLVHFAGPPRRHAATFFFLFATAASGTAMVLSLSRSAWIGSVAGAAVALRRPRGRPADPRARSRFTGLAVAALVIVLVGVGLFRLAGPSAMGSLSSRLESIVDTDTPGNSNLERVRLLRLTAQALPTYGWLGVGIGNFRHAVDTASIRLQHAHNMFLNLWVELGLLAVIGLVMLLAELWRIGSSAPPPGLAAAHRGVTSIGAAWVVNGLFETPTSSVFFWALLGLGLAMSTNVSAPRRGIAW